jgi:hypothetical protein
MQTKADHESATAGSMQDKIRQEGKTRRGMARQNETRQGSTGQDRIGQDKTRQDKAGQGMTRQRKARQQKTRQHNTTQFMKHWPKVSLMAFFHLIVALFSALLMMVYLVSEQPCRNDSSAL